MSKEVPKNFRIDEPTEGTLLEREESARRQGVNAIQSAWPAQAIGRGPSMGRNQNFAPRGGYQGSRPRGSGRGRYRGGLGGGGRVPQTRHPQDHLPAAGRPLQNGMGYYPTATDNYRMQTNRYHELPLTKDALNPHQIRRDEDEYYTPNPGVRSSFPSDHRRVYSDPNVNDSSARRDRNGPDFSGRNVNGPGSGRDIPRVNTAPVPERPSYRMPIQRSSDAWRTQKEIAIRVGPGLPNNVRTVDLYRAFCEYGEIDSIEIYEIDRTTGDKRGSGRITFKAVNTPFWQNPGLTYKGIPPRVPIFLLPDTRTHTISSPINKDVKYDRKYEFKAKSIDFGFLYQPETMMVMYSTKPTDDVTFEINLYKRTIAVSFSLVIDRYADSGVNDEIKSAVSSEASTPKPSKKRKEQFRFEIPFKDLKRLIEGTLDNDDRTFIIPYPNPPQYWRKLNDVAASHSRDDKTALYWNSFDAWFRQLHIVANPTASLTEAVSLRHKRPVIDIGRWTTYKITLDRAQTGPVFDEMLQALHDWNVPTTPLAQFVVRYDKNTLESVWDVIDHKPSTATGAFSLGELAGGIPVLPYEIRYQLEACISHNWLNEFNLDADFIQQLAALEKNKAIALLELVVARKERVFNPMEIFDWENVKRPSTDTRCLPTYCGIMRKATVTPAMIYFSTPSVETTNRVVRRFAEKGDRFLRVQFTDEKLRGRINSTDKNSNNEVFTRIKVCLDRGIQIGDRHFEFLACGNSQMREHGAYFFASDSSLSAQDIRQWMGEFKDIRVVAKHTARLGQCFSTTRAITSCKVDVETRPDIVHNSYTFSDGVGQISEFLSTLITSELKLPQDSGNPCSAFQFRLSGCKGVLVVWPKVAGRNVVIRPSQLKFAAAHDTLEVIRCSQFAPAALNRQLIIVMDALDVPPSVFTTKLLKMLSMYEQAMVDQKTALYLLQRHIDPNQATLAIASMVRDGFMELKEPFVMSLLQLWRAWTNKNLKEKARIIVEDGALLLGVIDETGILQGHFFAPDGSDKTDEDSLPQIFVQISDPGTEPGKEGRFRVITGKCLIARNPSLHAGDVRAVMAVDVPELHHLLDVVVFPQTGDRDIPSMLSGGDLDGDDYIVIWDKAMTTPVKNTPALAYTSQKATELDRDVDIKDITSFFVNYMRSDRLGTIANSHLAWADKNDDGVRSEQCIELAKLHSDAVDYAKTGKEAIMSKRLRARLYPHFMGKEPDRSYKSAKVLGRLFDMVESVNFVPCFDQKFNLDLIKKYKCTLEHANWARDLKNEYDTAVKRVMGQYAIRSEFEIYTTFVLSHEDTLKDYKFHEEIGRISMEIRDRFRAEVHAAVKADTALESSQVKLAKRVHAMYLITAHQVQEDVRKFVKEKQKKNPKRRAMIEEADIDKMSMMSFPWLFPETLGKLIKGTHEQPEFEEMDSEPLQVIGERELEQGMQSMKVEPVLVSTMIGGQDWEEVGVEIEE